MCAALSSEVCQGVKCVDSCEACGRCVGHLVLYLVGNSFLRLMCVYCCGGDGDLCVLFVAWCSLCGCRIVCVCIVLCVMRVCLCGRRVCRGVFLFVLRGR